MSRNTYYSCASALALFAAFMVSGNPAHAVPCGTIDPPQPFVPGTLTAQILCSGPGLDPVTNSTPGGFGRRNMTITNAVISGDVLNDVDSVLESNTNIPLFVTGSDIDGSIINNGLIAQSGTSFTVSIKGETQFDAFINNSVISSTSPETVLDFNGAISRTGIVNNGTASGTGGNLFQFDSFNILSGGLRATALSIMSAFGNMVTFRDFSVVTGTIDLDGTGTAQFGDIVRVQDQAVVNGDVILRGTFQAGGDGVETIGAGGINGGIDVFGSVTASASGLNVNGISRVTGNIRVLQGALVQGNNNGIDIAGFLGPIDGASKIQIWGTVRGGSGFGIQQSGAENAIVTEVFDGGALLGRVDGAFNGPAYQSFSNFNDILRFEGGLLEGGVFGDSSTEFADPNSDALIVQAADAGTAPMVMDLRDPNGWGHFFWKGGDALFGNLDLHTDIVRIERGAAILGDTAVDPHFQAEIPGNGPRHRILSRELTIGSVAQAALAFFDQSLLTKTGAVAGDTAFTVAPGSTLVLETGITDTFTANAAAGGAIAALPIPTPNDKCDYFLVACPYFPAAGFRVQIPRFLAQNGAFDGAHLALATDSVRFIHQARTGLTTKLYDDVIQDLSDAADALAGRFATVTTTARVFITATAHYRDGAEADVATGNYDNIDIELVSKTFQQAATTANGAAVGWALDNFAACYVAGNVCPDFFGDGQFAGTSLRAEWAAILESVSEFKSVADYERFGAAVQGSEYAQSLQLGLNLFEYWPQGVDARLRNALYGQAGVQLASDTGIAVASLGTAGLSGLGAAGAALGKARGGTDGWAFWGRGLAQFARADGDAEAQGYDYDTKGFQGGLDWTSPSGHFLVGGSLLWTRSQVDFSDARIAKSEVDTLQGGLYATYGFGHWYWNAQASIARNDVTLNRSIDLNLPLAMGGAFVERAQLWSDFEQTGWTAGTEIGTVWNHGAWNIQPYLGVKYRELSADDAVEASLGEGQPVVLPGGALGASRASPFALTIREGDAESLQSELGARFTTNWDFEGTMIRPEVEVTWRHEFLDTRHTVQAHFNSALTVAPGATPFASPDFVVASSEAGEDSLQLKAGINAVLDDEWELYAGYRGVFADGFQDHGVAVTLKTNW